MAENLQLGWYLDQPTKVVEIGATDIAHHTAVLAQSGSGKSFFLGRLVEEILLTTKARVVVIDPNGDFRAFHTVDDAAWDEPWWPDGVAPVEREKREVFVRMWAHKRIVHIRDREPAEDDGGSTVATDLWGQLTMGERLTACNEAGATPFAAEDLQELDDILGRPDTAPLRDLDGRSATLLGEMPTYHFGTERNTLLMSLLDRLDEMRANWRWRVDLCAKGMLETQAAGWDIGVLDLPAVEESDGPYRAVLQLLDTLWEGAEQLWETATVGAGPDTRVPVFIVIDEAHNLIVDEDPIQSDVDSPAAAKRLISQRVHRIAAEGRKYGLFLILATQRPGKVPLGLLQECENVCLLRLQSTIDHKAASDAWGIPQSMIERTRYFKTGDGLLFGRWVPAVSAFHAAHRRTKQGGASLDAGWWATPREG